MAEHDASYIKIDTEQYNFRDDTKLPADNPEATGDLTVEGDIYFHEGADPLSTQLSNKANSADLADVATSGEAEDVSYDNANSGLVAENVQAAIDEVVTDLSDKMNKSNPKGTGTFSLDRKTGSTVGLHSFAMGVDSVASGDYSFAMGENAEAVGDYSVAMGENAAANGDYSVAMGDSPTATGKGSVAMGDNAAASGNGAFAEGVETYAYGTGTHAEGYYTDAESNYQHVSGKFNIVDNADTYAEIIGNGTDDNNRSNARTLDWSGNEYLAGDLTINKGTASEMIVGQVLASKADASDLPSNSGYKDDFTDVSLASNTSWSTLASFNLTKGVWLVEIAAEFQNNNTNFRGIALYIGTSTPSSPSGIRYQNTVRAVDGAATIVNLCMPIDINSDRTIYILGRQNSGITLTTKPRACWVKIMPR